MRFPLLSLLCLPVLSHAAPDVVVADFEGNDFGSWKVSGEAFGKGPEAGTLPNQMPVSGFLGQRLLNGYHGGDDSEGKLESPDFKVERKYINFLIGGGKFPGETCIDLLQGNKVVRTATGRFNQPGGTERLEWQSWEVSDLAGKSVSLRITDKRKGGWGHINIDQVVQSDAPQTLELKKEFVINGRYLIWPVTRDASQKRRFFLTLDGQEKPLLFAEICLSNNPDFWVFTDLADYQGRKITVTGTLPGGLGEAWDKVKISPTYPGEESVYQEPLRSQYHFSSRRGWLNDPNGLVFKDGTWHLFYQHNPYNHNWDNMTWGHAVSNDLFHWKELPPAVHPDAEGLMFSGSAFVVPKSRTKLPIKGNEAIVIAYTSEGTLSYEPGRQASQSVAFSNDGGKTFEKFTGNPVLKHQIGGNRDPKVFWHEPTKHWVMPIYHDRDEYGLYTSTDLVDWERASTYRVISDGECPDLYELPVDGDPKNTRWVAWGAQGKYMLGSFDGKTFKAESGPHHHYFGAGYAGQTYSNAPDGRRVHIPWMRDGGAGLQGMPFNQQMGLPMDFTLRKQGDGIRLWAEPVKEVEGLRADTKEWKDFTYEAGQADPLGEFKGGQFEVEAVIDAGSSAAELGFRIFDDHAAIWKPGDKTFSGAEGPQPAVDGKVKMRIFVDTVSMEVFVNGTYVSKYIRQNPGAKPLRIVANGGAVKFDSLKVHTLKSAWSK